MSEDDRWLAERLATAPVSLRRCIEAGLAAGAAEAGAAAEGAGAAENLGSRFRAVAERLMTDAKSGPPTRETAMTLLAADALITLACEWDAERGVERVGKRL